jgi:hypothetical protein
MESIVLPNPLKKSIFFIGKPAKLWQRADPDWAPTLKMGHQTVSLKNTAMPAAVARHERRQRGTLRH